MPKKPSTQSDARAAYVWPPIPTAPEPIPHVSHPHAIAYGMAADRTNTTQAREALDAPLKDRNVAQAVNALRDIAIQFHSAEQLRERIAGVVRPLVARAAAPSTGEAAGIERAAKWIDQRLKDFMGTHAVKDPETGTWEYGTGPQAEAKCEYVNELGEIAEGLRALIPAPVLREGEQGVPPTRVVFAHLIETMAADNGCEFGHSEGDFREAAPAIRDLVAAGFFADDPADLDGSYWQCIGHDEDDAAEYFSRAAGAYAALGVVLNRIFDNPPKAEQAAPAVPSNFQCDDMIRVLLPDFDPAAYPDDVPLLRGRVRRAVARWGAPAAPANERTAFEAWIAKNGGDLRTFGSGFHTHYSNSAVNNAWTGWTARAALAAQLAAAAQEVKSRAQCPMPACHSRSVTPFAWLDNSWNCHCEACGQKWDETGWLKAIAAQAGEHEGADHG